MWADFLQLLRARHGYHPHRPAWLTTKQHMHDLIKEMAQRTGSACTLLRWHPRRCYGAAQLKRMGVMPAALLA